MDYNKSYKYFKGTSVGGGVVMIVIGVILFFIGFAWWPLIIFGLLLLGGGIAVIVAISKGRVSDAEYDSNVVQMLNGLQARALQKLGVDPDEVKEIAPIQFDGYTFDGANVGKVGNDGKWRTNWYKATYFFFSQNEVHCYVYKFNTLRNQFFEETEVYFYKDIVSCSTSTEVVQFLNNNVNYEYFKLTTTGGTSISASFRDIDYAQRSINAMRSLLKIKKMG